MTSVAPAVQNTRVDYRYRDASNYKFTPDVPVVVRGAFTPGQLARLTAALFEDDYFRHTLVGLPSAFPWEIAGYDYDPENDHDLHEFCTLTLTHEAATVDVDVETLVRAFERGSALQWLPTVPGMGLPAVGAAAV